MRYVTYEGRQVEAARITAADFNGKEFDGVPFTADEHLLTFIKQCAKDKVLDIHSEGCTDYARWVVKDEFGNALAVGEPGDYLVRAGNKLTVVKGEIFELGFRPLEKGVELTRENAEEGPRLEIEVRGTAYAGKSLIAAMIRRFLKQQGFKAVDLLGIEQGSPLALDSRAADFMQGHRPHYALSFLDTPIRVMDNCKHPEKS